MWQWKSLTILQCVQNTKQFIFSRFTILSYNNIFMTWKLLQDAHNPIDTKSTQHVEMGMWVWLVLFLAWSCTHPTSTLRLVLFLPVFVPKLHIVDVVCEVHVQWNLSSLIHCTDTFETISGVYLIEVSWFQGLSNMQIQHFIMSWIWRCPVLFLAEQQGTKLCYSHHKCVFCV